MTPEQRYKCMSQNKGKGTKPELVLRHALWRKGFRYRVNDKHLPGSPDIVLPKYRTVIFMHGCFWHGHKGCNNHTVPKTNTEFWAAKIARNQERDQEVWRKLEAKGWMVIIVWECQLKKAIIAETIERVQSEIIRNGDTFRNIQTERKKVRELYLQERKEQKDREFVLLSELKFS